MSVIKRTGSAEGQVLFSLTVYKYISTQCGHLHISRILALVFSIYKVITIYGSLTFCSTRIYSYITEIDCKLMVFYMLALSASEHCHFLPCLLLLSQAFSHWLADIHLTRVGQITRVYICS